MARKRTQGNEPRKNILTASLPARKGAPVLSPIHRADTCCSILTCLSGHTNSRTSQYNFDNMVGRPGREAAPRGLQHPSIRQSTSGSQNLNLLLLFAVTKLLQNCKIPAVTKTEQ